MPTPLAVIRAAAPFGRRPLHARDARIMTAAPTRVTRQCDLRRALCVHVRRGKLERPVADGSASTGRSTPDAMLYARAAKGFKSGGFNGRANTPAASTEYEPETVWSYEAGFKSRYRQPAHAQRRGSSTTTIATSRPASATAELDPILGSVAGALGAQRRQAAHPRRRTRGGVDAGRRPAARQPDRLPRRANIRSSRTTASRAAAAPSRRRPSRPKWTMRLGGQYAFALGRRAR